MSHGRAEDDDATSRAGDPLSDCLRPSSVAITGTTVRSRAWLSVFCTSVRVVPLGRAGLATGGEKSHDVLCLDSTIAMPVTWTLDQTLNLVILTIAAPYTMREWRRAMNAILASPARTPLRFLVDRRLAGAPPTEFIDEIVEYFSEHVDRLSGARSAIVVSDEASFGMSRMLEIRADIKHVPLTQQTFRSYDEAVRWLQDAPTA